MDTAKTLAPLQAISGYDLHKLKGEMKDFWAVKVTGNYRIIFRFERENAYDLDYIDYH